jgi:hypothetical protein
MEALSIDFLHVTEARRHHAVCDELVTIGNMTFLGGKGILAAVQKTKPRTDHPQSLIL